MSAIACWQDSRETYNVTAGDWKTEKAAQQDLIAFLKSSRAFVVREQVAGRPLWKHHFQDYQELRADVLLLPDTPLIEAGWRGGAIVVEVKRSGEKIGPGLNQLIDYLNAVFYLEGGIAIAPSFGFMFPMHEQVEAVASFMAHQHIGSASLRRGVLDFYCGHNRLVRIHESGQIKLGQFDFGRRLGRR